MDYVERGQGQSTLELEGALKVARFSFFDMLGVGPLSWVLTRRIGPISNQTDPNATK